MSKYDVCIIGAGPAGLASASRLAERGMKVALVECGGEKFDAQLQSLSDAEILDPRAHSPMADAVRRGLGGTSALWGGRCVALDKVDFSERTYVPNSGWPFKLDVLQKYYPKACKFLGVGEAGFELKDCRGLSTREERLSAQFADTEDLHSSTIERWAETPNVWKRYKRLLEANKNIEILHHRTCLGFIQDCPEADVTRAILKDSNDDRGALVELESRAFVIACGGVESTRLVLDSMNKPDGLKVESPHFVGRYYMGHPSGKISDIQLEGDPDSTIYGFERDGKTYVRRRITFSERYLIANRLLNIAFWFDNPPIAESNHGSGVLSAAYLALRTPLLRDILAPAAIRKRMGSTDGSIWRHVKNCLNSPLSTLLFCFNFASRRYLIKPRVPGFFTRSRSNRYALHYHSEQAPNWESLISLSSSLDATGVARARIGLKWTDKDVNSILRAHRALDLNLRQLGIGRLIYRYPEANLEKAIREQAVDGFHQIGTLRMARDASSGVTNQYGMIFGTRNCFVASSAAFPTSGQANPTLSIVALALRQADHIANLLRSKVS